MRGNVLAFGFIALTLTASRLATAQQDVSAIVEKAMPAVVVVQTPRGLGTAFLCHRMAPC